MGMLQDIRSKYPQYNDLSDADLAAALHGKYYADMPRAEFDAKVGYLGGLGQGLPRPEAPSRLESFGRGMLQGATFNLGDEIYASLTTEIPKGAKPTRGGLVMSRDDRAAMDQSYDDQLAAVRNANRAAADANPGTYFAGNIAGGVATAPFLPVAQGAGIAAGVRTGAGYGAVAGAGASEGGLANRAAGAAQGAAAGGVIGGGLTAAIRGVQGVRRAYANQGEAGAYGQAAESLPGTVDDFADAIASGATRANAASNRRTLDILGEEMQRAGGDVQQAQAATIARISQELSVTPQTAAAHIRRLTQVHADNPLMFGEYPSVAASDAAQRLRRPQNIDLDDLGRVEDTRTQATLDYLANNGNAQSAQDVRNAISLRQEGMAPQMRDTLEGFSPQVQTGPRTTRPANIVDTADMVEQARQLSRQEYNAAYAAPVATPQRYQQLPRFFEYLANRAATSSPEVARTIRNAVDQIAIRLPNGQLGVQGLRQMQTGRTTIRGQMEGLVRSGRADLANEIRPFYNLLTRVMEDMSPAWAQANRRWADMNLQQVAQDLGDAFATKAGPQFREQLAQFEGLAPEAQNIVRVHVLQKLYDKIDNLGDTHSVSKLFSNDASRNLVRRMFGDEAAATFARAVRDQKVAEISQGMTKNSATHRRGMAQQQADAETGLVAAVENANARGVRNWLLERMTQLLTERRNRPMADILTTPMNDTAAVARHLHNMRRQQQRLQQINQSGTSGSLLLPASAPATGAATGESADEDGRMQSRNYIRGGMGDDYLMGDPLLMQSAAQTANWGEPPRNSLRPFSRSAGYANPADKQAQADEAAAFWKGAGAGLADLGGATSRGARAVGLEGVANALEAPQQDSPLGSFIGQFNPSAIPGVVYDIGEGIRDTLFEEDSPPPKAIDRDKFFSERRRPRETLEEAQARAERDFMASVGYKTMIEKEMVTKAKQALAEAGERAKQTWRESQGGRRDEEAAIERDYRAHLADINKQLEAYHSRGFSERNPWFKSAVGLGSLMSGGFAMRGLNKLSSKGDDLIRGVDAARQGGNVREIAEAENALEAWNKSLLRKQATTVGLSSTIPMDLRGIADVVDAYGLPATYQDAAGELQSVPANERARSHLPHDLESTGTFLYDNIPAILSGFIGAGVGAKWAKPAPVEKASARTKTDYDYGDIKTREMKIDNASDEVSSLRSALDSKNQALARQQARSDAAPPRSSRRAGPVGANTQGQSSTAVAVRGQGGGGTKKASATPREKKDAYNRFLDDVEAVYKGGGDLGSIKASNYPAVDEATVNAAVRRLKNLNDKRKPASAAKLISIMRSTGNLKDKW